MRSSRRVYPTLPCTMCLGCVEGGGVDRDRGEHGARLLAVKLCNPRSIFVGSPLYFGSAGMLSFSVYFKREGEKGRENRTGVCSPWSNSPFFFLSQVYSFWTGLSKFRLGEVGDVGVEMPGSWTCKAKGAFTLEFKRERERGCGILVQHTMYYIHVRYPRHMTGHHFGVLFFPPLGRSCRLSIPHSF